MNFDTLLASGSCQEQCSSQHATSLPCTTIWCIRSACATQLQLLSAVPGCVFVVRHCCQVLLILKENTADDSHTGAAGTEREHHWCWCVGVVGKDTHTHTHKRICMASRSKARAPTIGTPTVAMCTPTCWCAVKQSKPHSLAPPAAVYSGQTLARQWCKCKSFSDGRFCSPPPMHAPITSRQMPIACGARKHLHWWFTARFPASATQCHVPRIKGISSTSDHSLNRPCTINM